MEAVSLGDWDSILPASSDSYWLRSYVEAAASVERGRAALVRNRSAAMAVVLRDIPGTGLIDAITPYGYGGPIALNGEPVGAGFWSDWDRWCGANRVVSSFVRFHPLLDNAASCPAAAAVSGTVAWPTPPGADLFRGLHPRHRNKVRRAARAGVEVRIVTAPSCLAEFTRLYFATMDRVRAAPSYYFPAPYWARLRALGDGLILAEARLGGTLVAASLCMAGPEWLHYHLSASANGDRSCGAAQLMLLKLAQWGQQAGLAAFHLGGGLGGAEDTLLHFKRRFAPEPALLPFAVARLIHDSDRYRALCSSAPPGGRFPEYRAVA